MGRNVRKLRYMSGLIAQKRTPNTLGVCSVVGRIVYARSCVNYTINGSVGFLLQLWVMRCFIEVILEYSWASEANLQACAQSHLLTHYFRGGIGPMRHCPRINLGYRGYQSHCRFHRTPPPDKKSLEAPEPTYHSTIG